VSDPVTLSFPPDAVRAIAQEVAEEMVGQIKSASNAAERVTGSGSLALTKEQAAAAIGVSIDSLERHVLADIRLVRCGTKPLIPVPELIDWLDRNAAFLGERA
jgi:hypothetical protein